MAIVQTKSRELAEPGVYQFPNKKKDTLIALNVAQAEAMESFGLKRIGDVPDLEAEAKKAKAKAEQAEAEKAK